GVGNDEDSATDGAVQGHIVGTYLHGPVLARNPALADRLLSWVVGPLAPLVVPEVEHLRSERLAAEEPSPGATPSATPASPPPASPAGAAAAAERATRPPRWFRPAARCA